MQAVPAAVGELVGVSCTDPGSCEALGTAGNGLTAAGWDGTKWTAQVVPSDASATPHGVSCSAWNDCEAVAGDTGDTGLALHWSGTGWSAQPTPPLSGTQADLNAVSCSPSVCTAVGDSNGSPDPVAERYDASTPPTSGAPLNSAAPTISGSPMQGSTVTESHGTWNGSPTGYGYQWQDCDTSGANCQDISRATNQSYVLAAGDVGHTVRVLEWAANSAGVTGPVASVVTGTVRGTSGQQTAPGQATKLTLSLPRRVCAAISTGHACLSEPRSGRIVYVPGATGWRAGLRLTTSGGQPIGGASVQITDGSRNQTVQTNAGGRASFSVSGSVNRTVQVRYAGASGINGANASVRIVGRAVSTLRLVSARTPGKVLLAGVAVDDSGVRAETKVQIQLLRNGHWKTVTVVTSIKGKGRWNVTIAVPSSGRWKVRTRIEGTATTAVSIDVS
jgi:hypothetical protein